jgi:hypothetical protein
MTAMAGTVSAKAGQNWDKLEAIFEQRTAKAMNKLGVPTAKDVDALIKRVDDLAAAVAKLSKGGQSSAVAKRSSAGAVVKAAVKAPTKKAPCPPCSQDGGRRLTSAAGRGGNQGARGAPLLMSGPPPLR